jgi:hypothetical protein
VYLWPRHKVALDGHASAKKMCKSYLKIRCLSMFEVCGRRRNKVGCEIAYHFLPCLTKSKLRIYCTASMTFFTSWILSLYVFDMSINLFLSIYDFLDLNTRVSPSVTIIVSAYNGSNAVAIKYP